MPRQNAQLHRLRNKAAVSLPIGPTQYLTATEARKLARALNALASDIKARTFTESTFGTRLVTVEAPESMS